MGSAQVRGELGSADLGDDVGPLSLQRFDLIEKLLLLALLLRELLSSRRHSEAGGAGGLGWAVSKEDQMAEGERGQHRGDVSHGDAPPRL